MPAWSRWRQYFHMGTRGTWERSQAPGQCAIAMPRLAHVRRCLDNSAAPVIAVRADSVMDASAPWFAVTALTALAGDGALPVQFVDEALRR